MDRTIYSSPMNLTAGKTLQHGKYLLHQVLAQGPATITLKATQVHLNQAVVIQTLRTDPQVIVDRAQLHREFLDSVRSFAQCQHPHLIRLLDCFEEAGQPFAVLEYVAGQSLADLVKSADPLPESEAIAYIRQASVAIAALHDKGLLHRAVQPANLICVSHSKTVILVGFELGPTLALQPQAVSPSDNAYAAIEQFQEPVRLTPATDIYGLAASLYWCVTGRTPVAASQREQIPLPTPRQLRPDLSSAVDAAILCGMQLLPQQRPQSIPGWLDILPAASVAASPSLSLPAVTPVPLVVEAAQPDMTDAAATGHPDNCNRSDNGKAIPAPDTPTVKETVSEPPAATAKTAATAAHTIPAVPPVPKPISIAPAIPAKPLVVGSRSLQKNLMLWIAAISASAGLGLGLALRLTSSTTPGTSFFHTEQAFPRFDNWPGEAQPTPLPSVNSSARQDYERSPSIEPILPRPTPVVKEATPTSTPEPSLQPSPATNPETATNAETAPNEPGKTPVIPAPTPAPAAAPPGEPAVPEPAVLEPPPVAPAPAPSQPPATSSAN